MLVVCFGSLQKKEEAARMDDPPLSCKILLLEGNRDSGNSWFGFLLGRLFGVILGS